MLSVANLILFVVMLVGSSSACARELYILVVGESASANCNVEVSAAAVGVYQISLSGAEKPAVDPLEWADCNGGSIWLPLGREMIRDGFASKVVFLPLAVSHARAEDWTSGGRASTLLTRAIDTANKKNIVFDFALYQAGVSDSETAASEYRSQLRMLIKSISFKVKVKRWLISQGAGCPLNPASQVHLVHEDISRAHQINWFPGADFRNMSKADYGPACTYSATGQLKAARSWLEQIKKSDIDNENFQKESLLYFFR